MRFLHETQAGLFALGNTRQLFSSMHASYLKQQNHNPNHRNVENMTLNTVLKGPSSKSEQKQQCPLDRPQPGMSAFDNSIFFFRSMYEHKCLGKSKYQFDDYR